MLSEFLQRKSFWVAFKCVCQLTASCQHEDMMPHYQMKLLGLKKSRDVSSRLCTSRIIFDLHSLELVIWVKYSKNVVKPSSIQLINDLLLCIFSTRSRRSKEKTQISHVSAYDIWHGGVGCHYYSDWIPYNVSDRWFSSAPGYNFCNFNCFRRCSNNCLN